jgi:hypothetical protein
VAGAPFPPAAPPEAASGRQAAPPFDPLAEGARPKAAGPPHSQADRLETSPEAQDDSQLLNYTSKKEAGKVSKLTNVEQARRSRPTDKPI